MCTKIFICHGDIVKKVANIYNKEQIAFKEDLAKKDVNDCKMVKFYITNDGKYAVDADFVENNNLDDINLENVPKIKIDMKFTK